MTTITTTNPVRSDVASIYAKLHAGGRAEAIAKARDAGLGRPT